MKHFKKLITIALALSLCLSFSGCCSNKSEESSLLKDVKSFNVSSTSVVNNELKTKCCYKDAAPKGDNISPDLSWDSVDGASCYAIYMYDFDAKNYLHWKVADVTGTHIAEGAMTSELMYIGPFPPNGTHNYAITVYALKEKPETYEGETNNFSDVDAIEKSLDTVNNKSGNVIAVGTLDFKVSRGRKVN